MISISVKSDIAAAVRGLSALQREQIPFAASVAINDTANDAKEGIRKHLAARLVPHLHPPVGPPATCAPAHRAAKPLLELSGGG